MDRYVALGSSMAAGPGIAPRAPGSPRLALRSARNYPHLLAADLGLDLVDVTYSGATTAHVLDDPAERRSPAGRGARRHRVARDDHHRRQRHRLRAGHVRRHPPRRRPGSSPSPGRGCGKVLDRTEREVALVEVAASLRAVARAVRERSPAGPGRLRRLPDAAAAGRASGRSRSARATPTSPATSPTGSRRSPPRPPPRPAASWCRPAAASREHHAWSDGPVDRRRGPAVPRPAAGLPPERDRHAQGRRPARGPPRETHPSVRRTARGSAPGGPGSSRPSPPRPTSPPARATTSRSR